MVVLDRKQGGKEKIEAKGYSFASIFEPNESGLIEVSKDANQ